MWQRANNGVAELLPDAAANGVQHRDLHKGARPPKVTKRENVGGQRNFDGPINIRMRFIARDTATPRRQEPVGFLIIIIIIISHCLSGVCDRRDLTAAFYVSRRGIKHVSNLLSENHSQERRDDAVLQTQASCKQSFALRRYKLQLFLRPRCHVRDIFSVLEKNCKSQRLIFLWHFSNTFEDEFLFR